MEHSTQDILTLYSQKNQEVYLERAARAKQMEEYPEQFEEVCLYFYSFFIQIFINRMMIDMVSQLYAGGLSQ
jgi:hypothetical protein